MPEPKINIKDTRNIKNKKVDKRFVFKYMFKYIKPYVPLLCLVFLCNICATVLSLVGPKLCGLAIDVIKPSGTDFVKIRNYALILVGVFALSAGLEYLSSLGMSYISRSMVKKLRSDVFRHLSALPVSYFDNRQAGDIISVLSYDIDTVGESLASDVMIVLKSSVLIIGSFVMMMTIAPVLVLIFVITVPLSVIMTKFIVGRVQPLFRKRSLKLGELNGFVEEVTAGQKTTRAYGCEQKMIADFEVKNRDAIDAYTKAEYYGTISGPSVGLINNISLSLVSIFGALMFMAGYVSPGNISSFILYSRKFSGPINEIANIMGEFQSAIAAAERVFGVFKEAKEPSDEGKKELSNVRGDVEIEHLGFSYIKGTPVIKDLSLSVKKGQVVAIVGHTGAGKTTVINLMMRFYDIDRGSLKIDGVDVNELTRTSVRRAFTMVLQDTWLFAGTVFENVAYGNKNATKEDVIRVCKSARIHQFIERLPNGYDTVLTDNAVNISKGQKQLLTIARAMLKDSPMLILDEATSNVDTRTEQLIQEAMKELMKDRTCFVIAHRLSTVKNADNILVMRDGDVVEMGTHDELMAKSGYYSELYYSQFETA